MLREFLTSIADKLRELLGTTDTINAQNFVTKIDDVYDAGYEKGKAEGGGSIDWSGCTDFSYFSYKNNRNDLVTKLKYSDTSNGTTFYHMFSYCSGLSQIPLFDTSKGTNFERMFNECTGLTEIPEIDTSKGTNLQYMFNRCNKIKTIPKINTSNATKMTYFFYDCHKLETMPEIDTSKNTSFANFFYRCYALTEIPPIDTSSATDVQGMFRDCTGLTEIPEIDTSKVTSAQNMFNGCTNLVTIPKLNLSSGTSTFNTMNAMFTNCASLENVNFEGTVKITANISVFSYSPNLTVDSLMSFINALSDNTGVSTTYTVTIGSTNLAKLTEEQKAIATAKNIKLA